MRVRVRRAGVALMVQRYAAARRGACAGHLVVWRWLLWEQLEQTCYTGHAHAARAVTSSSTAYRANTDR